MLLMNSISTTDTASADCSDRADSVPKPPLTLDVSVLKSLQHLESRLGKRVLPGMFDILNRHLPRSCVQMWQALAEDDTETLWQIAHKLKSSARCLGLSRLGEICARLERHVKAGQLRGVDRQLAAIEDEYDRATSALQPFLA